MIKSRESHAKVIKPRKGQPPKLTTALVIYRKQYQDYQIEVLEMLQKLVKDN